MQQLIPDSLSITLGQQQIPDCLKSVPNLGETIHMNVCTGAEYMVPWGTLDWMLFVVVVGVLLAIVLGITMMFLDGF